MSNSEDWRPDEPPAQDHSAMPLDNAAPFTFPETSPAVGPRFGAFGQTASWVAICVMMAYLIFAHQEKREIQASKNFRRLSMFLPSAMGKLLFIEAETPGKHEQNLEVA